MTVDLRTALIESIVRWLVSIGWHEDVACAVAREFARNHEAAE